MGGHAKPGRGLPAVSPPRAGPVRTHPENLRGAPGKVRRMGEAPGPGRLAVSGIVPPGELSPARARTDPGSPTRGRAQKAERRKRLPPDRRLAGVLQVLRERAAVARERGGASFAAASLETIAQSVERRGN